jgi:hypothetical protein
MIGMVDSTGKGVVVNCSTSPLKPCKQTRPHVRRDFELNRTAGLLLNDHGSGSNFRSGHEGSDLHFDEIATTQLAVDCEVKQGAISHASLPVEEEADRPNLALF